MMCVIGITVVGRVRVASRRHGSSSVHLNYQHILHTTTICTVQPNVLVRARVCERGIQARLDVVSAFKS